MKTLFETFTLSTTELSFFQLQDYMNEMKQDWNWSECKVITKDNEIIFELYVEDTEE